MQAASVCQQGFPAGPLKSPGVYLALTGVPAHNLLLLRWMLTFIPLAMLIKRSLRSYCYIRSNSRWTLKGHLGVSTWGHP